jgi:hypothetical protein
VPLTARAPGFVCSKSPACANYADFESADDRWATGRPTHAFGLPERAVDRALAEGRISAPLPYIKKMGVAAPATGLDEFYRSP